MSHNISSGKPPRSNVERIPISREAQSYLNYSSKVETVQIRLQKPSLSRCPSAGQDKQQNHNKENISQLSNTIDLSPYPRNHKKTLSTAVRDHKQVLLLLNTLNCSRLSTAPSSGKRSENQSQHTNRTPTSRGSESEDIGLNSNTSEQLSVQTENTPRNNNNSNTNKITYPINNNIQCAGNNNNQSNNSSNGNNRTQGAYTLSGNTTPINETSQKVQLSSWKTPQRPQSSSTIGIHSNTNNCNYNSNNRPYTREKPRENSKSNGSFSNNTNTIIADTYNSFSSCLKNKYPNQTDINNIPLSAAKTSTSTLERSPTGITKGMRGNSKQFSNRNSNSNSTTVMTTASPARQCYTTSNIQQNSNGFYKYLPAKKINQRVQSAVIPQQQNKCKYNDQDYCDEDLLHIHMNNLDKTIQIDQCQPLQKIRVDIKPPVVTAKSWAIYDGCSGQFIEGKIPHQQREVASLTKIMTCYTVLQFFERKLQKDMKTVMCRVSERAAAMQGTSACLRVGHILSVWDLLHGLMLPSGNDSAVCLAENIGSMMQMYHFHKEEFLQVDDSKLHCFLDKLVTPSQAMSRFLLSMNQHAGELTMYNTYYSNPHGLKNPLNKSTAHDIGKICISAMENEYFRQIVSTIEYQTTQYSYKWENTNKLLHSNWAGIKTGITDAAGPCLATCVKLIEKNTGVCRSVIIVILASQNRDIRWMETQKLAAWTIKVAQEAKE